MLFPSEFERFIASAPNAGLISARLQNLFSTEKEYLLGKYFSNLGRRTEWFESVGQKNLVYPPEKVRGRVLFDIHNHPSGRRIPSLQDIVHAQWGEQLELSIVDPLRRRILQMYDPNYFMQVDKDWAYKWPLLDKPQVYKLPPLLINSIRDRLLKNMLGEQLTIKDKPATKHPLFKSWLEELQNQVKGDISL